MRYWLLLMLLLGSAPARAGDIHVLELNTMSMDYERLPNNRDIYLPYEDWGRDRYETDETWKYSIGVNFDLDLIRFAPDYRLHWNNRVAGSSTDSLFRQVGWNFRWGLQLGPVVELMFDHTSEHILDEAPVRQRTYRLRNAYGCEITFYRRKE